MLIAGALVFNYVITVENIPKTLAAMQGLRALAARLPAARERAAADPRLLPRRARRSCW
jgi:hypothetical protein